MAHKLKYTPLAIKRRNLRLVRYWKQMAEVQARLERGDTTGWKFYGGQAPRPEAVAEG